MRAHSRSNCLKPFRVLVPVLAFLSAPCLRAGPPAIDLGWGGTSLGHLGAHVSLGWTMGGLHHAVQAQGSGELFPEALPEEAVTNFSYMAGPYWNRTFAFASVSAGISVLRFEERAGPGRPNPDCAGSWFFTCPDSIHARKETLTVGIPVAMLFSPKLWYVGPGIRVWTNANLHRPMLGASFVAFFGGGPTRRREE